MTNFYDTLLGREHLVLEFSICIAVFGFLWFIFKDPPSGGSSGRSGSTSSSFADMGAEMLCI